MLILLVKTFVHLSFGHHQLRLPFDLLFPPRVSFIYFSFPPCCTLSAWFSRTPENWKMLQVHLPFALQTTEEEQEEQSSREQNIQLMMNWFMFAYSLPTLQQRYSFLHCHFHYNFLFLFRFAIYLVACHHRCIDCSFKFQWNFAIKLKLLFLGKVITKSNSY